MGVILSHAYKSTILVNLVTVQYEKPIDSSQDVIDTGSLIFDNNINLTLSIELYCRIDSTSTSIHFSSWGVYKNNTTAISKGDFSSFLIRLNLITILNIILIQIYKDQVLGQNGLFTYDGTSNLDRFLGLLSSGQGIAILARSQILPDRHLYRSGNDDIFTYYCGFVVPKNSLWKDKIDYVMSRILEAGIYQHLVEIYENVYEDEQLEKVIINNPISIWNFRNYLYYILTKSWILSFWLIRNQNVYI